MEGAEGGGSRMCGVPGQSERGGYLANLYSSVGVYGPGQKADYQCSKGFTLLGNATRLCQEDGLWSGSWPRCGEHFNSYHTARHHRYRNIIIKPCDLLEAIDFHPELPDL